MDYQNLLEIIKRRRSVRSYKPEPVPLEDVMKVLEAAHWAPSGNNTQPWEFVVVRSKDKLSEVVAILDEQSERLRQYSINFKTAPRKSYLNDVSALVFVCGDPRFKPAYPRSDASEEMAKMFRENSDKIYMETITAAICNILLAATSLGLGMVWLTGTGESITEKQLRKALKIPGVLDIICCIPLGYPATDKLSPRTPRPLESVVHLDQFDTSKWRTDEEVKRYIEDPHVRAEFFKTGHMPPAQR